MLTALRQRWWEAGWRAQGYLYRATLERNLKHHLPAKTIDVPTEAHGNTRSEYRVCPRGLSSSSVVYSLGVGSNISFDLSLIARLGVTVYAFDPTPESAAFVAKTRPPAEFRFRQIGVSGRDGTMQLTTIKAASRYYRPATLLRIRDDEATSVTVDVRSLGTIMTELGHDHIDLLKMDIEGGEYAVLDALLESPVRPGQILVEFHPALLNVELHGHMFGSAGWAQTRRYVERLMASGYDLFHVANRGTEMSFLKTR